MRAFAFLTASVLATIGIGVGTLAGGKQQPSPNPPQLLAKQSCRLQPDEVVECPEGSSHYIDIPTGGRHGCVEVYTKTEFEFRMYCQSGPTRGSVNPAWKLLYAAFSKITSECPPLVGFTDGTAGPAFCTDGRPNPPAVRYFQPLGLATLEALGREPTLHMLEGALCPAERQGSIQVALQSYDLAARIEGWNFRLGVRDLFDDLEAC